MKFVKDFFLNFILIVLCFLKKEIIYSEPPILNDKLTVNAAAVTAEMENCGLWPDILGSF